MTLQGQQGFPDPATKPTVSVEEAGRLLGISRTAAFNGVRSGRIPSIKLGARITRVPTARLQAMLDGDTKSPPAT
jgi:hypothetical protein